MQYNKPFSKIEIILKDSKSRDSDFPLTTKIEYFDAKIKIDGFLFIVTVKVPKEEVDGWLNVEEHKIFLSSDIVAYRTYHK